MQATKYISPILAIYVVIFFPNFGKCAQNPKEPNDSVAIPKEDEATICFKKLEKGQIDCNKVKECIQELRDKNGEGTFISIEKAFKDYIDRSITEGLRITHKISELSKQIENNGTNPSCPAPIWMPAANGEIPLGTLSIAQQSKIYIGRAYFREQVYRPGPKFSNKLMPGKIQVGHTAAYIPAFPIELSIFEYEVLIIPYEVIEWVPFKNSLPKNAIIGGYEEHLEKENIYIGRVKQSRDYFSEENYEVGPVLMEEETYKLITTYNYRAFKHDEFEILVLKNESNCVLK